MDGTGRGLEERGLLVREVVDLVALLLVAVGVTSVYYIAPGGMMIHLLYDILGKATVLGDTASIEVFT